MRKDFEQIAIGEIVDVFERSKDGDDEFHCASGKVIEKRETSSAKIIVIAESADESVHSHHSYELGSMYAVYNGLPPSPDTIESLKAWKREAMVVISRWNDVAEFVSTHGARLGYNVSEEALRLLKEAYSEKEA